MSQRRFAILRANIGRELENLERLVAEAEEWRPRLSDWPNTVRVRTAGGILHDFYCGVERIFRHIAIRIDEDLPGDADWHIQLLQRMTMDIETIRPAVLDRETAQQLDEYLRFRHLFRNIYGFDLEWERCRQLLDDLPTTFKRLLQRLVDFDEFLRTLEREVQDLAS
jgi:hypothetical protein